MEPDMKSVQDIVEDLNQKLGFDCNRPYLSPEKLKTKLDTGDNGFRDDTVRFIQSLRKGMSRTLPLKDVDNRNFYYCVTSEIEEYLHHIDMEFNDYFSRPIGKGGEKVQVIELLRDSMIEEPYYSCALSGEMCKLRRARDIIKRACHP
ncbi:MAG: hypothetical protein OEZ36_08400, partial [Spirochaetota bacterium]|nr:hypothetical protein [Spirochaetota bacterium]